eukprot:scaffold35878_cov33-Attheya_sp.AAC.2
MNYGEIWDIPVRSLNQCRADQYNEVDYISNKANEGKRNIGNCHNRMREGRKRILSWWGG